MNERADEFRDIYRKHRLKYDDQRQFEINARSCTLLNGESQKDALWITGLRFRVPIYQRPYSWKTPEIRRFVEEIISSFRGRNGKPKEEPMFIGTMQLTDKRSIDENGAQQLQEVIDGQQRLSTLILMLKILKDCTPDDPRWIDLDITNRLDTSVNGGEQRKYLHEALAVDSKSPNEPGQNPYLIVMPLIRDLLEIGGEYNKEETENNPDESGPLNIGRFVSYLTNHVYFVVIETRATLSKTLRIFDAINTSGMDLNGGDVFKIRYYEYLRVTERVDESEFERISGLYRAIDEKNREAGRQVCSIEDILSLAQHLLIARHEMPKALHDYGASVFFERFFDTVLSVNVWPNFSLQNCKQVEVRLDELNRLIDARFAWDKQVLKLGIEARAALEFIEWSRYAKYRYIIILFQHRFGVDQEPAESLIIQLSKLMVLFSILYWRTVYRMRDIMHDLQGRISGPNATASATEAVNYVHQRTLEQKHEIERALNDFEIAHNPTAKGLACRLSALQDEMQAGERNAAQVTSILFGREIDIEHIESLNHKDEVERTKIKSLWGSELDRIGNLMVLERSLNRSISNEDYVTEKLPAYRDKSDFEQVRQHARHYPQWDLDACKARRATEVSKLVTYLCS